MPTVQLNNDLEVKQLAIGKREAASMIGAAAVMLSVAKPAAAALQKFENSREKTMVYNFYPKNNEVYSYDFELIEDQTDKITVIDDTPDDGIPFGTHGGRSGRALEDKFLPRQIKLHGPKRELPDLYNAYTCLVNDVFKNILEQIEPKTHQFFPIELIWKDGSHAANKYWFNPCNRLDSVNREKTTVPFQNIWKPYRGGEFVFDKARIEGCHAWQDKFISGGGVLISDVLAEELKAANLSGLSLVYLGNAE